MTSNHLSMSSLACQLFHTNTIQAFLHGHPVYYSDFITNLSHTNTIQAFLHVHSVCYFDFTADLRSEARFRMRKV